MSSSTGHSLTAGQQAEKPDLYRTPRARALAALRDAWGYYTYGDLHESGTDYLRGRGIDVAALEVEVDRPVVGHTPYKAPDQLVQRLRSKGYTDDELVDAGLARRTAGETVIDYYRKRLLVPVMDDSSTVVGLIGRLDSKRAGVPKYINPPHTACYNKSVNLYRPSLPALDPDAQVVVCEGTLDALAIAAQAARSGLSSKYAPVAESGLAVSEMQWETILAIHDRPPVLCADGDGAGQKASAEWAAAVAERGRESCITWWPAGQDPASWIAEHGENGLAAVTRKGCLDAPADQLRPRHSASVAVQMLLDGAAGKGIEAQATAVLSPLDRMNGAASDRYMKAAADVLVPLAISRVQVGIAVEAHSDKYRRLDAVVGHVAVWGARLAAPAQDGYARCAGRALAWAGYGPDGYLERKVSAAIRAKVYDVLGDGWEVGQTLTLRREGVL